MAEDPFKNTTQRVGEAQAIIEAVERLGAPELVQLEDDDGIENDIAFVPRGMQVVDLLPFQNARRAQPLRKEGTAKLTTLDSFIDYVQRHEDENSVVFAIDDVNAPKLLCVFDAHEKGSEGKPRFGKHRALYEFPVDEAWKVWTGLAKGPISQAQLASLLEDRIGDVMDPQMVGTTIQELAAKLGIELASPAALLALSRGVAIRADLKVAQAISLQTGETRVSFEETHVREGDSKPITVPGGFAIAIPVFRAGDPYQVAVRLRYRRVDAGIVWLFALHRTDVIFQNAFESACKLVDENVGAELFYGTPES